MSPCIRYVKKKFGAETLAMIVQANAIIAEYIAQGYRLTLRQLYYQFVSRDLIANRVQEYKRLGGIVNDARLAGMIDWDSIEDRTRNLESLAHWRGPREILSAVAQQFRIDRWATQPHRVEVWVEKEALAGIFESACVPLDVPFLSCRGYTSQSEMWGAAMRLRAHSKAGQETVILHFGDHDPSGMDMTRDIKDRMRVFGCDVDVRRLALNMEQVDRWSPPPNPAKTTDSRFAAYLQAYGDESWELDALEPSVLADLVTREVMALVEPAPWEEAEEESERSRALLGATSTRWDEVVAMLNE